MTEGVDVVRVSHALRHFDAKQSHSIGHGGAHCSTQRKPEVADIVIAFLGLTWRQQHVHTPKLEPVFAPGVHSNAPLSPDAPLDHPRTWRMAESSAEVLDKLFRQADTSGDGAISLQVCTTPVRLCAERLNCILGCGGVLRSS